ncbi:type VI secretion system baseplate subunit TssF [Lewinella sp. IMCC34191]|uniref:type VI secretion system baseplate subunit TssF n=1 Tax=Lewinella sp. IMCC34191 TaxID=2259172 RepID=UPI0013004396|nr:type VI secretion system baseplate subunit TssF [Lewinella sp. IMCC34191]
MDGQEQIRNRILRAAARHWGYQESEMDLQAFDPLVRLLVDACSGEVARLERMLAESETRIMERMLEQLAPEVSTGPRPAHAVAFVRALNGTETVTPDLQLYASIDRKGQKGEIYFRPLAPTPVVNGRIACLEAGGSTLWAIGEKQGREKLATGKGGLAERGSTLYIGLELNRSVSSLSNLRFYFNWMNALRLDENLEWLRQAEWSCAGHPLRVASESDILRSRNGGDTADAFLESEYRRYPREVAEVSSFYADHLVTIECFAAPQAEPELALLTAFYPPEFEALYPPEKLVVLDHKLVWIKVVFPTQMSGRELQATTCVLNPVPVANLRPHTVAGRLRDQVNIIPLDTEHHYFDILAVRSRRGMAYDEVPLTNIRRYQAGQYSVRRRDVGKFEHRDAGRMLYQLLDLLREESAAFSAYGKDALQSKITALNQHLKDLEQQLQLEPEGTGSRAFVVVSPLSEDRFVDVAYLSTQAEAANDILAGESLELVRFAGIDRKSLHLVTSTSGGRAPLSYQERKYAYKKAIVSRGRVVTREDIRAFCEADLGRLLTGGIRIRKAYAQGHGGQHGMERILEVSVGVGETEGADIGSRLSALERQLNRKSTGVLPIRVVAAENVVV